MPYAYNRANVDSGVQYQSFKLTRIKCLLEYLTTFIVGRLELEFHTFWSSYRLQLRAGD